MESNLLHRKESLILTAIDVINELGIQGLSIREVAKRQGIATASIFGHFKSKNDLVIAVLNHFSQYDLAISQSVLSKNLKSKESIEFCIDLFYTYYENYPAITAIDQAFDVLRCEPEFSEKICYIYNSRICFLNKLIKKAQKDEEISSVVESETIADIIIGSCKEVCFKWRVSGYAFPLRERVLYTLRIMLDSFTKK